MAIPDTAFTAEPSHPLTGQPALCLHCSTGSARQWLSLETAFCETHHVFAPDLLGYGENPPWPRHRGLHLCEEVARLLPLLARIGEPVDVIGHSFGAAVAVKLALDHPKRVRSLCIYEPVLLGLLRADRGSALAYSEILMISSLIGGALDHGDRDAAAARFIDFWSGDGSWSRMPEPRRRGVRERIHKVRADFEALLGEDVTLAALARLDVPVLCMSGNRSPRATRRVADLLGAALPDVRRARFDDAGHMGPLSHAGDVNACIEEFFKFLLRREIHTSFDARAA